MELITIKYAYSIDPEKDRCSWNIYPKEILINPKYIQTIEEGVYYFKGEKLEAVYSHFERLKLDRYFGKNVRFEWFETSGLDKICIGMKCVYVTIANNKYPIVDMTLSEFLEMIRK